MKSKHSKEFINWLETSRGLVRPLLDTMKKCMLQPVPTAAGLGNPPNKWVNNTTESFHPDIKEELKNASLDVCTFLDRVRDTVFRQQTDELIRGVYSMGEYRLIESNKKTLESVP